MRSKLLLLFSLFLFVQVTGQETLDKLLQKYNSGNVPYMSVEELRMNQLNNEVLILDAREYEEYEVSHIKNALFLGYDNFEISKLNAYSKDTPIVVYCSLGIRSEKIAKKLEKAGYNKVWNLYGGIFSWKDTGYEVINMEGQETEKVHAYSKTWSKWLNNAQKIY